MIFNEPTYDIEQSEWPTIIYTDQPVGQTPTTNTPNQEPVTVTNQIEDGIKIMNEKSEVPCNCVREPCECSAQPFSTASTPPPIVTIQHVYRRVNERDSTPVQSSTNATSKNPAATPEILGLPWYVVAGGAALVLWALSSGGSK